MDLRTQFSELQQGQLYQYELIYKKLRSTVYVLLLIFKAFSKFLYQFAWKIQMSPILFVAILKLFITNTVQNLIRFGDFQNIVPPQSPGMWYYNCGTNCSSWYTTAPPYRIELLLFINVPGQSYTTTTVNMVQDNFIHLCQDFKVVEIAKIYQYTFDMRCYPMLGFNSCSVWVILNDQVIDGSNRTHTDYLTRQNVGYMNITQQNNTICFQSRNIPFNGYEGAIIDNITLQIHTEKIACNVLGCKFCKLNFPDICQVCEYMFILKGYSCQCSSKFYLNGSVCNVCLFPCETCQRQAKNCLSCTSFYRLQENQCVIADKLTLTASTIASMPGLEFFSIGKIYLASLDQFWPYYSHHRVYGNQTIDILTFIHTLQNNKWFLFGLDNKIDFNFQSLNFSDYSAYSNQQFLRMESRTSYFWDGAFEIVLFSFPTMLLVLFVFNRIFYLTFEYRISRHFRPFSFLLMIYFLGIGEDISYLSFLSFNNAMSLFSFKFQDKLGHIVWVFVFFLLVFFCSGGYFLAKILYKKLSKHFLDGFFPKLQSFHILGCLSIKQFVIGSINSLIATKYETLIISLGSIEIFFLIGIIYLQWKNRCYQIQTFMLIYMLKSIVMTLFNISLWVDWKIRQSQQTDSEQQTKKLLDFNCKALVIVIFGLEVLQTISAYFSGREMLKHRRKKQAAEAQKHKSQVLKIIRIKQNAQVKQEITVKQQMGAQKNYLYQTKALEKAVNQSSFEIRIQKIKKIKIKKAPKNNNKQLSIIHQQDDQNEQPFEIIIINGWNDT